MPTLAVNKRAKFEYEILETLEAGIVLSGQEVKSVRAKRANLSGAFVTIHESALRLTNVAIPPWQPKNTPSDYEEQRPRKLLVHKRELASLIGKIQTQGLTAVPLRLYTRGRRIKAEIALVRYRKKHDRREVIKKRQAEREMRRALKNA